MIVKRDIKTNVTKSISLGKEALDNNYEIKKHALFKEAGEKTSRYTITLCFSIRPADNESKIYFELEGYGYFDLDKFPDEIKPKDLFECIQIIYNEFDSFFKLNKMFTGSIVIHPNFQVFESTLQELLNKQHR